MTPRGRVALSAAPGLGRSTASPLGRPRGVSAAVLTIVGGGKGCASPGAGSPWSVWTPEHTLTLVLAAGAPSPQTGLAAAVTLPAAQNNTAARVHLQGVGHPSSHDQLGGRQLPRATNCNVTCNL